MITDIPIDEFNFFVSTGEVSDARLKNIATKIKNNISLSIREHAFLINKTHQINNILKQFKNEEAI